MRWPFGRARRNAELDEEIRTHLAMARKDRMARGEPASLADHAALREFGNVAAVKELTRNMWGGAGLERALQDLRYAARSLGRSPAFTAIAVLTIGLGIGANTAMFTVVNGVLLRPLSFPRADRLFLVSYKERTSWSPDPALLDAQFLEYRARQRSFQDLAAYSSSPITLTGRGDPVRLEGARVTPELYAVLGVPPALGATFEPGAGEKGHEPVVLLSDRLWRDRFGGDAGVVGTAVMLDGVPTTVVGVMPPEFEFPGHTRLWRPLAVTVDPHNTWMTPVLGRLKDGVTPGQALAELNTIAPDLSILSGQEREKVLAQVLPLQEVLTGNVTRPLWILEGAVGFVLLIACANVANLLLMRSASRRQEFAVRAALGAGRARLMRQLLTESGLIAAAGGAVGVVFAVLGVRALVALAPVGRIPRVESLQVDGTVLLFTAVLAALTGLGFGLVPALRVTRRGVRDSLGGGPRVAESHGRLRAALVVSEIAIALVLLAGAGLMIRSFGRMRSVDLGFRPEHVVALTVDLPRTGYPTPDPMRRFDQAVLDGLARLPGVEVAGAVNWMPLGGALTTGDFHLEEPRELPRGATWVSKDVVSAGYFRTWGIRVLRGREFTERDGADAPAVAIMSDEVARKLWPDGNAIGKRITLADHPGPGDWITVIGVVDDVVQQGVTARRTPALYRHYPQVAETFFLDHMTFGVRTTANPAALATAMREVVRIADPNLPVQRLAPMEDLVSATTAEPLFQTRLLGLFSALALVLAAVGIYGVLAYSVAERTHEIGIRLALGARGTDVSRMIVGGALRLSLPGVLLGLAGALALTRVLARLLFGVKPNDPATLVAVALLLGAVSLVAAWLPARRAARVDPQAALRAV